jgi:hypothetical protein
VSNCDFSGKANLYAVLLGFENNLSSYSFAGKISGLNIKMSTGGGVRSFIQDNIITNCYIEVPSGGYGIYYCTAKNCKIIGTAYGCKLNSCNIEALNTGGDAVYNSPIVHNCELKSQGNGIRARKGFANCSFVGNTIEAPTNGIIMQNAADGGGENTIIQGNVLSRPAATDNTNTTGIDVSYGKNILVSDNVIKLHTTAGNSIGYQAAIKTFGSSNLVSGNVLYINV